MSGCAHMNPAERCASCLGPTVRTHDCDACHGTGAVGVHFWLCPVCLGSGRISDAMPVVDALADAETLHFYAEQERYIPPDGNLLIDVLVAYGAGPAWWFDRAYAIPVADTASMIAAYARAAFRACPMLREE